MCLGVVVLERAAKAFAGRGLRTKRTSSLHPRASAYLVSVASDGECLPLPDSMRATADCVVPIFSATCAWVKPCAVRAFKNSSKRENSSASFSYSAFTLALAIALVRSCLCVSIFLLNHAIGAMKVSCQSSWRQRQSINLQLLIVMFNLAFHTRNIVLLR